MPMDRSQYPDDWEAISQRVRFERAGGRCECRGECGNKHETNEELNGEVSWSRRITDRCGAVHGELIPLNPKGSLVVLTTAHLDRDPSGTDESHMRAMCQRCHLAYDAQAR